MNAGLNWLKTGLALMFFLCALFLMPETNPVRPIVPFAPALGPVHVPAPALESAPAPVSGLAGDEPFAREFGRVPTGDPAIPIAAAGGTMARGGHTGAPLEWHPNRGGPARARTARWSANG